MGLALIGPPGVGKGTQAARLRDEFERAHIATGDLLRQHRAGDTELGRQASEYMTAGRLVPDDLVVAMVQDRIEVTRRFLLDGFPRTLAQADALDQVLRLTHRELTAAVFIDAPDEIVVERIAGRADGPPAARAVSPEHGARDRPLRAPRRPAPHRRLAANRGRLRRGACCALQRPRRNLTEVTCVSCWVLLTC